MRRRYKIVMSAVAAAVPLAGWLAFVPAATAGLPPYDNTNDTVRCLTVTKGIIKANPPLQFGGALPTTISISGTLGGCTSPSHPTLVFPEGKSKFKGTLLAPTNDCTNLNGPTTGTGTIVFTWSATDTGAGGARPEKQHAESSGRRRRRGNIHVTDTTKRGGYRVRPVRRWHRQWRRGAVGDRRLPGGQRGCHVRRNDRHVAVCPDGRRRLPRPAEQRYQAAQHWCCRYPAPVVDSSWDSGTGYLPARAGAFGLRPRGVLRRCAAASPWRRSRSRRGRPPGKRSPCEGSRR